MEEQQNGRLQFIKNVTLAGIGIGLSGPITTLYGRESAIKKTRVGMIGLDTSHCIAFAKMLNAPDAPTEFGGYKIVAAYPKGSNDIKSSVERIPEYTNEIKQYGVAIVDSIEGLLKKVDVVVLETNDGRLHLQQALPVIKAGKPLFIDKPITASLKDAIAIFDAAKKYNVPVFSSSSLRFMENVQDVVVRNKVGKILGADTYSPAELEKTHPDLFWYGIHGVELLYTVMGTGCKTVVRVHTESTDVVVGTWEDGRIGTFRGTRAGEHEYGGTVFGEKGNAILGPYEGYRPLLLKITEFFKTGIPPVSAEETLEILAFMDAADSSKLKGGILVEVENIFIKAGYIKK
ncbi:MAG: Gfo/Idh/MocA family oxidoreductase [Chitinophagaceae bacterium]